MDKQRKSSSIRVRKKVKKTPPFVTVMSGNKNFSIIITTALENEKVNGKKISLVNLDTENIIVCIKSHEILSQIRNYYPYLEDKMDQQRFLEISETLGDLVDSITRKDLVCFPLDTDN